MSLFNFSKSNFRFRSVRTSTSKNASSLLKDRIVSTGVRNVTPKLSTAPPPIEDLFINKLPSSTEEIKTQVITKSGVNLHPDLKVKPPVSDSESVLDASAGTSSYVRLAVGIGAAVLLYFVFKPKKSKLY